MLRRIKILFALAVWLVACQTTPPNMWLTRASLREPRSWFGTATVAGKIYALGGMVGADGARRDTNEVFDPRANAWSTLAPMPSARASLAVVAVGDTIYALGGYLENGTTNRVEAFDTTTGRWRALPPMPTPRFDLSANVIGETIYALGGFDDAVMNVVEAYETTTQQWRALPPMLRARYAFSSLVLDGKLYAFGGRGERDALDTIEVFDPQTQTWSILNTKIPEPIAGFGTVYAEGWVHVLKYDKHFAYNLQTHAWRTDLPPMPTSRHGLKADYIDGVIYTVGGCSTGDGNLFDVARNEAFPLHPPAYLTLRGAPMELPTIVYPAMLAAAIFIWFMLRRALSAVSSTR
ncbi:MAG: hypothetical protein HY868_10315 [Chloroflexi bacterium]|nr:hypothetical protein [Chloroflexota bacterium]